MADNALEAKMRELEELQTKLSREEFVAKAEKELRPLWEQEMRANGANEPDWAPLEKVLPYKWCAGFMFMGYEGEVRIYKQGFTRGCLYVDPEGNTYVRGSIGLLKVPNEIAIESVFDGIEEMGFKRSTPYNDKNAAKRRRKIEAETGYKILTFGNSDRDGSSN